MYELAVPISYAKIFARIVPALGDCAAGM